MESTTYTLAGNWEPHNKNRLEKLLAEKAHGNHYAVFDWDFTCIFFDVQDSLFFYQLEQLAFKLSPEAFSKVIRADIPQDIPFKSLLYKSIRCPDLLTARQLSSDLDKRYRFLYDAYSGLNGSIPLEKIRLTDEYRDFIVKMLVYMRAVFSICPVDIAQSVSAGMNTDELSHLVKAAIDASLASDIITGSISSPESCAGEAGVFEVPYQKGIRIQPEIQQLIHTMNRCGIAVYICSASQEDTVRVFASDPGYGYCVQPERVFGRRRIKDSHNRFTAYRDMSIPQTWHEGKAAVIRQLIAPQHEGKPPILIAGDSDGDFEMMDDFKNDSVLLILHRQLDASAKITAFTEQGLAQRDNPAASILVQHRNEATGLFCTAASC